ncbi:MAG: UDP-N-acetylmuramate--L-alanine ligase [Thermodesulfovibrionia bacterium]
MYKRFERIHLIGIGGSGMSGIAEVLKNIGYEVTGSDIKETETTMRLRTLGIGITIGHEAENIGHADVVVVSSAISDDNPEVIEAKKRAIPVIPRAEMLAELGRLKYGVLIAGAHGKTTTTSIIASIMSSARLDPTVIIGGKLKGMGSNAKLGSGDFLVAEADESDGSFLKLTPTISVVTNIDREHMDFFKDINQLKEAFLTFINKVPFYGIAIVCGDDRYIKGLMPYIQRRFITYGLSEGLNLVARNIKTEGARTMFDAFFNDEYLGNFDIPLIGEHNVYNSLAAIGVAKELEIDMDIVRDSLRDFSGVHRRFETKAVVKGIRVIDDYGHHPTEIRATLRAARQVMSQISDDNKGRLIVLFQPHRYTRTRDLLSEFYDAFVDADMVILMDIYPAGEMPINGIDSGLLAKGIRESGKMVEYIKDRGEVINYLINNLKGGDTLITLGAGDVWRMGEEFIKLKVANRG